MVKTVIFETKTKQKGKAAVDREGVGPRTRIFDTFVFGIPFTMYIHMCPVGNRGKIVRI